MTRVAPLLPSFARGEITPNLYGRSDLEPYSTCLKRCRNMWIRPYGIASRIPGSEYLGAVKGGAKTRLLKFSYSADDTYLIECGAGYFRFYRKGGIILNGNGEPYEIANPFTAEQLASIQYVQINDVLKIVYQDDINHNNKPLELIRRASNNWQLKETAFNPCPYMDENATATTITPSGTTGNITLHASSPIFNVNQVGTFFYLGSAVNVNGVNKQGYVKIEGVNSTTEATAKVIWQLSGSAATALWAEGAFSKYRGYPSCIGLYQGRLIYGRTPAKPRGLFLSRPYAYENFANAVSNENSGAINIELASNSSSDGSGITWINGANSLVVGTRGNEFIISASNAAALSPLNVTAEAKSNIGSEAISPIIADSELNFIARGGKKLRSFKYNYATDSYQTVDMSLFSTHLLSSKIISMAHQKNPDSIIYLVREDGKVVMLTLEANEQIRAWSLLEFKGKVKAVEALPLGDEDEVYYIIEREIAGETKYYLEAINNFENSGERDELLYLRSALSYDGFLKEKPPLSLTLETEREGLASVNADFFTEEHTLRRLRIRNAKKETVFEGEIIEVIDSRHIRLKLTLKPLDFIAGESLNNIPALNYAVSAKNIAGLNHLKGERVGVYADGSALPDRTVTSTGEVELEEDAFYVSIGLRYASVLETMPLEMGALNGTAVGKRKRINETAVRVKDTLGALIGVGEDALTPLIYRDNEKNMGEKIPLFTGIIPNLKIKDSGFKWEVSLILKQEEPFPMNILAIAPMVSEQDK